MANEIGFWSEDWGEIRSASQTDPLPVTEIQRPVRTYVRPQIVVSTTVPTKIVSGDPNRRSVTITNITGTQNLFWSHDKNVTTSNGDLIGSTSGAYLSIDTTGEVWCLAATSAQTVSVVEQVYE